MPLDGTFQPMEVLPANGRITFHWLKGAISYYLILTRFYILILVLDDRDNSEKVRNIFQRSVYLNCIFCEVTADFHKVKH